MRNRDTFITPTHAATMRGGRKPETPIEALMLAGNHENIEESVEELQPFREAVADCIDLLNEQDRFIVDAVNSEMISLEELGKRLGVSKPHAWRLRNAAYDRLRIHLLEHPIIRERLGLEDEADNGGF